MTTYELADVACMLCGRFGGMARRDHPGAPLSFRTSAEQPWQPIRNISVLRCTKCAGALYLDEFETRREYNPDALAEEDATRPRRGRPPRPFKLAGRAA